MAELIDMPFGLSTPVGRKKDVLLGATWRIRLNRPFAAMQPYGKLLWPPLFLLIQYIEDFRTV